MSIEAFYCLFRHRFVEIYFPTSATLGIASTSHHARRCILINWLDHPALTWDIIKEAGEICAGLGAKHGYQFNCTSNFTHPQFPRLWNDIARHQSLTAKIRGAG